MKNVEALHSNLCNYCGTCIAVCPLKSLVARNEKIYVNGDCDSCGLCIEVCTGIKVPFIELNNYVFGSYTQNVMGSYKSIRAAHSTDGQIRYNASSGGVVTSLLVYALETGMIDGAVVVGMSSKEPWKCEIKIARTKDEIISSSQSKYTLVPLNSVLSRLKNEKGNFAVVGLPCHVHGIRTLQQRNEEVAKKIKLVIGIFCGFNLHYAATEYLIRKLNVNKEDIKSLEYRGGKWPGGFRIVDKKGEVKFVKKFYYNYLNYMYVPKRCLFCIDLTNELADISIGDAWIKSLGREGWSTTIIRTDIGEKLIKNAVEDGYLNVKEISTDDFIKSHSHLIRHKKKGAFIRMNASKIKPEYDIEKPAILPKEYVTELLIFTQITLLSNKYIRTIVGMLPLRVLGMLSLIGRRVIRK